jgi:hypothetical protein
MEKIREEMAELFRDRLGVSVARVGQSYQKPYDHRFDTVPYPQGARIQEFSKFSDENGRSTHEHIGQFLAHLGELADGEAFRVRLFSLSITGTAFAWYAALPPNSINSWNDLESKFHEHFFSGEYKLGLADLASVQQGREESVSDYIRRFWDTRNRCFRIHVADKKLAGLTFGLLSYLRDKLDGTQFFSIAQLHQRALDCESRFKGTSKSIARTIHLVERDNSDDESADVYAAEFIWPTKAKSSACSSLQPVQKNRQEEIKFTLNVAKCDRIFDELLKNGNIKLTHTIPPMDELKRRAYCKWHNSFSHARQIQSAINEGRLTFQEMRVDTQPFPVNTIEPTCKEVLVRPELADKGKDKNTIIDDPCTSNVSQEGIARKAPDRKTNSSEAQRNILNQAAEQNSLTQASQTVRHLGADGPVLMRTVWLTQPDSPPMARGVSLHIKQGKKRKGKAHMVDWSKPALLLISCSPNMLARRPFYVIDQQRNLGRPIKQNGRTKRPKRRRNKHRLFIL